jgi:hypothetical protein
MKSLTTWIVIALVALSFAATSALAFGDCAGKTHKPVKKITKTESGTPKSG